MIEINEKAKCSGCWACANVCPQKCISMEPDDLGFLYPKVDLQRCINCGLCEKTCPIVNKQKYANECCNQSYALRNKDIAVRTQSSSGGVFSLLAQKVLSEGGVVYGAAFDNEFHIQHVIAVDSASVGRMRGSKIIQSSVGLVYQDVKLQLEAGNLVLFTGTPCQVSGLVSFLGKQYKNLLTQDIICHGVCSPAVYDRYRAYIEERQGSKISHINFRSKETGWRNYSVSVDYINRTKTIVPHGRDELMRIYLKNFALRPSCYECPFKGNHRASDITLADFWGIEHFKKSFDDDLGVSFVTCHSPSGHKYIEAISQEADIDMVNYEDVIKYNLSGEISPPKPMNNSEFCNSFFKEPFENVVEKYCRVSLVSKIKNLVRSIVPK